MHELSLCQSIVDIVDRSREGRRVVTVELTIGQLRQVVPETLASCWELVTHASDLAGSQLQIEHVPVELDCRACGSRGAMADELVIGCPRCGSRQVRVVRGEEFVVTALELADEREGARHG